MHRFYLPPGQCQGATLTLPEAEAHHALHVLRLQVGDPVVVLDGTGREWSCVVARTGRRMMELSVRESKTHEPPAWRLTLLQALPKGKVFDTIVQKATELGTWRIVPLLSERTVSRPDLAQVPSKLEHWRRTAIESIKQCGSPWLPQLERPVTLAAWLDRRETFDLMLVASLQPGSQQPTAALRAFQARHHRAPASIAIWIGPEGDFTDGEYAALQAAGAMPVTLGRWVLRADTAAFYCLAVVNCELQAGLAGVHIV